MKIQHSYTTKFFQRGFYKLTELAPDVEYPPKINKRLERLYHVVNAKFPLRIQIIRTKKMKPMRAEHRE